MYAQVLTQGYTILFTFDGTLYDYRASRDGQSVILCSSAPAPEATASAPPAAQVVETQEATPEATDAMTDDATPESTAEAGAASIVESLEGDFAAPLAWSPGGETLAAATMPDPSASEWSRVLLLDPTNLSAEPRTVQTLQPVSALAYHAAEPVVFLVVGGLGGAVSILQVEPEGFDVLPMQTDEGAGAVNSVSINADGTIIASASGSSSASEGEQDNAVRLWNANTGALIRALTSESPVGSVAFSPDGSLLAYGTADGVVHVVPVDTRGALGTETTLEGHNDAVRDLAFSPDGQQLVSGSMDGTARLWRVGETGAEPFVLEGAGDGSVLAVAFSPDGALVAMASGSPDADSAASPVSLWDAATGDLLATLSAHDTPVGDLAFSPDGALLASVANDGVLIIWEIAS